MGNVEVVLALALAGIPESMQATSGSTPGTTFVVDKK